jgi:hypothetical protein
VKENALTTEANLEKVYTEMKRVRIERRTIEKTLETLAESLIPEEQISPDEVKELKALKREAEHGECIPLEQVLKRHGAKQVILF